MTVDFTVKTLSNHDSKRPQNVYFKTFIRHVKEISTYKIVFYIRDC